jgi:2-keto-4-pentenoate hydratase/2-oxohepta-3-ene-1,7-dioic acid hydratase in catechol pathway
MPAPKFASFSVAGQPGYGLITDSGVIDLSKRYAAKWPTLREVVADGALERLSEEGAGLTVDWTVKDITYEVPIPAPEKILCVGVNYPDRNAEYKDGQAAPSNPSLFVRFARSFTGHEQPLVAPAESIQLDYEGEIVIVIGRGGRRIAERDALNHIAALSLANEGTLRDWVRHAKFNVTQGKNFDRSGAIGPWLIPFSDEAQIADNRRPGFWCVI